MPFQRSSLPAVAVAVLISCCRAADWPQFRGPAMDGVAEDSHPPVEWSAAKNVTWSVEVPGVGWSQPAVWGDRVFVTTAVAPDGSKPTPGNWGPGKDVGFGAVLGLKGSDPTPPDVVYQWKVICLDRKTGSIVWERTAKEGKPTIAIHGNNTYASETPVTDGERVIAYFGMTGVFCYDLDGKPLWSKDLGSRPMRWGWGTGSSPALHDGLVFIQCDNEEESFLVALDAKTGDERWRVARDEKSNWSTPYVWKNKFRTELVTAGGGAMRSYDPASGELLWEIDGKGRTAVTPVGDAEHVYLDSADRLMGRSGTLVAVKTGAKGDLSLADGESKSEFVAWSTDLKAYRTASPLLYDGKLYVFEQQSDIARVFDAATGELLKRERLDGASGFSASPVAAGGKVYCLDQSGRTIVLEPGDSFKILATNELPSSDLSWSSPAVAGDSLLIRTLGRLTCVGKP